MRSSAKLTEQRQTDVCVSQEPFTISCVLAVSIGVVARFESVESAVKTARGQQTNNQQFRQNKTFRIMTKAKRKAVQPEDMASMGFKKDSQASCRTPSPALETLT